MVNPGHLSGACMTCKIRHVKCDEARPKCLRCTKSKRACLGYRGRHQVQVDSAVRQVDSKSMAEVWPTLSIAVPPRIGNVPVCFAENFIQSSSKPRDPRGFLDGLEIVFAQSNERDALQNVLDVFTLCYSSLSEPLQTISERRELNSRYQVAIRDIRHSLFPGNGSQSLILAVFLLALFEMIVNTCPNDRTWQIHVHGLLTLLVQCNMTCGCAKISPRMNVSVNSMSSRLASECSPETSKEQVISLMHKLQVQFYRLAPELDSVFRGSTRPRKIDVYKIRIITKRLYRELYAIRCMLQPEVANRMIDAHTILIWNNLLMTLIAAGTFLLESGAYLNSGDNSARTQESQTLKTTTQECINGILSSMAHTFGNVFALDPSSVHLEDSHFKALDGLPLIWPAYVASKAPGITNAQRRFLKNTLSAIGEVAHVPKAIALAQCTENGFSYSEVAAGGTLVSLGFCVTNSCNHTSWSH